jgi:hypothetical protein
VVRTGRERRAVSAVSSGPPHAKTMNAPGKLRKISPVLGIYVIRPAPAKARGSWSGRIKVGNGDGFCLFGCPLSGSKLVDGMQYVRAVVPVPAPITDADCYVL